MDVGINQFRCSTLELEGRSKKGPYPQHVSGFWRRGLANPGDDQFHYHHHD
jgi:hypothetical protein